MDPSDLALGSEVLQKRWRELQKNGQRAKELAGVLSEPQLWWRSEEGRWSVGECLDHLVRTGEAYLDVIDPALEKARAQGQTAQGPPHRNFLERFLVNGVKPPVRIRIPAPSSVRPRRPGAGDDSSVRPLARFRELRERYAERLRSSDGIDLQRTRLRSPFLPILSMSLDTALAVVCGHERRHLAQAERVRRSDGFPSA